MIRVRTICHLSVVYFCVACVAWQTHRDHFVRLCHRRGQRRHRHWCRRHTFCFCSITFEGMFRFHPNSAELYITIKYRTSLILVIVMALFHQPRWLSWMRRPTGDQEVAGSTPAEVGNIFCGEFDHEIFSTVILPLPLIQEGQLSVSGERICTILVNRLED